MLFWELTPDELSIMVEAYTEREKRKQEEAITVGYMSAYWNAVWQSGKKPDSLEKILNPKKKEMSPTEILETVKQLHKLHGGK